MNSGRGAGAAARGSRAFRHRPYRLFFAGQTVALAGVWMQSVAIAWLVLELTDDPLALGLVGAAQFGPVVALGLFGGLLADHLPKRQTVQVTHVAELVLSLMLFVLAVTGIVELWHVLAVSVAVGIANAIGLPTRQAFVVEMVGPEDLISAVGINSAIANATRVVGPAVGGLIVGFLGPEWAILASAACFVPAIVAYALIRDAELQRGMTPAPPGGLRAIGASIRAGLGYVGRTPLVLLAIVTASLGATFGMNFQVVIPPLARDILGADAAGFGYLIAASGLGSTAAGVAIATAHQVTGRQVAVGAIVLGLASIVIAAVPHYAVTAVAMFVAGAGGVGMAAVGMTTIQTTTPHELRGRVISIWTVAFMGSIPVGGVLLGWLASGWGVQLAIGLGGIACTAVGLFAWRPISRAPRPGATSPKLPFDGPVGGFGLSQASATSLEPRAAVGTSMPITATDARPAAGPDPRAEPGS